jgi:hypothetical protein
MRNRGQRNVVGRKHAPSYEGQLMDGWMDGGWMKERKARTCTQRSCIATQRSACPDSWTVANTVHTIDQTVAEDYGWPRVASGRHIATICSDSIRIRRLHSPVIRNGRKIPYDSRKF